jgi:trimeric autotransporter adhesin
MKKITLLFLALTGMLNVANAQMLFDFDTVNADHVFTEVWNGTWPNTAFAKVSNPDVSGINTSANVGKYTANGGADAQLNSEDVGSATLPDFDFATNPYLTMKVWVGKPVSVTIEFKNNGYYPGFGTLTKSVTTVNQWVTIEFNCSEFVSGGIHGWGTYNIIGVSFDKDLSGGTVANDIYYFDDIKLSATPTTTTWSTFWSNGTPDSTVEAIIDGTYSGVSFSAKKLTVNATKSLTINSGTNVTIQNEVINDGTLIVENNANLIQVNPAAVNTGNVTIKRNSNDLLRLDYSLWSSPVSGTQTLAQFSPSTSQSPNRFYTYDTANSQYDNTNIPTTDTFGQATGYLIRMPNDASAITPTAYAGMFTGVLNNGTINKTITDSGSGYNMIGNPYSSTISADDFMTTNTASIESTLYFWRKTNLAGGSAYATYTPMGGAGTTASASGAILTPNGSIQVGQGFFVKAKTGATSVSFTNSMRETAPTSTQFFRTKQAVQLDRIWLNLTNTSGVFSQTLVGYTADATLGVDAYDGLYFNDSPVALTSNINGSEYAVQGRPAFDASDSVSLNFKTDVAGDYTIAIDHTDGVFSAGQDVYLVDNTTGTETNLKTDSYTFTASAGTASTRFSLKYQKTLKVDAPAFNENSVTVYRNNGTLYVNSESSTINNIKVYDVLGRLLAEQKNVNASTATIKTLKSNQILIVKVSSQDSTTVSKKVVN